MAIMSAAKSRQEEVSLLGLTPDELLASVQQTELKTPTLHKNTAASRSRINPSVGLTQDEMGYAVSVAMRPQVEQGHTEEKIILYHTSDGKVTVNVRFENDTFWMTQKSISQLFDVQIPAIAKHLKNIYEEEELDRELTISKMEIVQTEGGRKVMRSMDFYNLDAIIAVGYRVNSKKATGFRQWATKTLKEYIQKGFILSRFRVQLAVSIARQALFPQPTDSHA
jgi:hypothetical protein